MSIRKVLTIALVASAVMLAVGIGPRFTESAQALPQAQESDPAGACPECSRGVTIPYPGRLNDEAGQPVADGAYDFTFALYDAETGGEPLWSEVQEGVAVGGGAFVASLGSANPIPKEVLDGSTGLTASGGARWLAVGVRGPGESDFTALTPRQRLSATAPAAPASPTNGMTCPHDHFGETWSGSGIGLHVTSTSDTAVWAESSGGWAGVDGRNTTGAGVYGYSSSGDGVYGYALAAGRSGVYGYNAGSGSGVFGRGADGDGVFGEASAAGKSGTVGWNTGSGYGVYGSSDSGIGVYGNAIGSSYAVGVAGHADNTGCTSGYFGCSGAYGRSDKGNGITGYAETGVGVYAYSSSGVGLRVENQSSGNLIEAWHGPMFSDREFYVSHYGEVYADGSFHTGGADFAEMLPAVEGLEPGDVLVVGPDGELTRNTQPYQASVVGVYSTRPGFVGGAGDDVDLSGKIPLAMVGVAPVKVSAENGPIGPGDLLVASSIPGHAMKAAPNPAVGTVIGKALEGLDEGTGIIQMLVMLQ